MFKDCSKHTVLNDAKKAIYHLAAPVTEALQWDDEKEREGFLWDGLNCHRLQWALQSDSEHTEGRMTKHSIHFHRAKHAYRQREQELQNYTYKICATAVQQTASTQTHSGAW